MFIRTKPAGPMLIALMLGACTSSLASQQRSDRLPPPALPAPTVEIMLLGTLHFDQQDSALFDIRDSARQREVEQAVSRLARFRPTKVMVEWQPYFAQRLLDSTFAEYRAGRFRLPRNEIHQLGFRLAAQAGHTRVWAVDHPGFWLGDSLRAVATAMGQTALLDGDAPFTHPRPEDLLPRSALLARATVTGMLAWMNSREYQALMYDAYVNRMARVGIAPDDDFDTASNGIGGQHLAEWVRRNIKIYRMILSRTTYAPGERIVVIIGADHVAPLRQLLQANLNFRVVDVRDYLESSAPR